MAWILHLSIEDTLTYWLNGSNGYTRLVILEKEREADC
jgi:hypothetical protein